MNRMQKIFGVVTGASLALAMAAPVTRANKQSELTKMTFEQPVEIPGHVLAPGTYYFTRAYNGSGPDVNLIEIYSAGDRSTDIFLQTESVLRPETERNDQTVLTFAKEAKDAPLTLIDWFYPGETHGHVFVYTPLKEMQIRESAKIVLAGTRLGSAPVAHASLAGGE